MAVSFRLCCAVSREFFYQTAVVLCASSYIMSSVMVYSWPSPALAMLMASDSPIPITATDTTWFLSCLMAGMLIAPLPMAWAVEAYGRKRALLIATVPLLGAWIAIFNAQGIYLICVFQLLGGFALGCGNIALPIYVTEISSVRIRGYLGILVMVMMKSGLLYSYGVGPFISLGLLSWLGSIPAFVFLLAYRWLPESPYYLLSAGKVASAEHTVQRLRCRDDVQSEIQSMREEIERTAPKGTISELWRNPGHRRSLCTVIGLSALIELCGSQLLLHYAQTLFVRIDSVDPRYASVAFGFVNWSAALVACGLADTMGRRPQMLLSIVGTAVANAAIAVYFVLDRYEYDLSSIAWLPLAGILTVMFTYTIGILSLLTVITSELFPTHLRGIAMSVKFMTYSLVGLGMVQLYGVIMPLGSDYMFGGFAVVTVAFIPFVLYRLPETKRRTLQEITDEIQVKHATAK